MKIHKKLRSVWQLLLRLAKTQFIISDPFVEGRHSPQGSSPPDIDLNPPYTVTPHLFLILFLARQSRQSDGSNHLRGWIRVLESSRAPTGKGKRLFLAFELLYSVSKKGDLWDTPRRSSVALLLPRRRRRSENAEPTSPSIPHFVSPSHFYPPFSHFKKWTQIKYSSRAPRDM